VTEARAVFRSASDEEPNGNVPGDNPPGTVGVNGATPGDPHGLVFEDGGPGGLWPRSRMVASPWSGWPAEWNTPTLNGRVDALTDTAWACLDKNASVLATMPPYLVGASGSLPVDWLNNPDPERYASWHAFAHQLFWEYQLGEAFVIATARYSNGYPARFHVVPGWMVNVEMDGSARVYRIGSMDVTADMLHIPYQISEGEAHGHGPLEAGAARVVAARALARYAANLAASGAIPNAVLKHPHNLNAQQAQDLQMAWVEARTSGMGLPAVLSGGIDFETLQLSPADMALLELSQFMESRIAVLLGVPPTLMGLPSGGDPMTYVNVNGLYVHHWRSGLSPKADAVMSALSGWALPRGTTVEVNRDEYVKPELKERAETYAILSNIRDPEGTPVLTVTEIRELERFSNAAPSATLTSGVLQ
jgi:HK97 family phage portal protein